MSPMKLCNENLPSLPDFVRRPRYDRARLRTGIAHIGVGNFHRVHQASIIDDFLESSDNLSWGITGISMTESAGAAAKAQAYLAQDCLYSITELADEAPQPVRVIGAMRDYLYGPTQTEAVHRTLCDENTRIVSLTITEGGYNPAGGSDAVFGTIAKALDARMRAGRLPFTIMSCDNLPRNGDAAREATLAVADAFGSDLARWIDTEGAFPNSMVDRIAPTISAEDRAKLNAASGIDDAFPATHEAFSSWVVEDRFCAGRPNLQGAIEFRDDAADFVQVKGRLSNAAHMLMSYPSLLLGHRKVHEGMSDPDIPRLIRVFWQSDAFPLVAAPPGFSVPAFTERVLQRFADPLINDDLERVASDGTAKIRAFWGRTIQELLARQGSYERIAFLFATFWTYLRGKDDTGRSFDVVEPGFSASDQKLLASGDPAALFKTGPFSRMNIARNERFMERYRSLVHALETDGCKRTLVAILT